MMESYNSPSAIFLEEAASSSASRIKSSNESEGAVDVESLDWSSDNVGSGSDNAWFSEGKDSVSEFERVVSGSVDSGSDEVALLPQADSRNREVIINTYRIFFMVYIVLSGVFPTSIPEKGESYNA